MSDEMHGGSEPRVPASAGPSARRDDSAELAVVANTALVGVPTAYAMSHSTLITVIAATAACLMVIAYLGLRR